MIWHLVLQLLVHTQATVNNNRHRHEADRCQRRTWHLQLMPCVSTQVMTVVIVMDMSKMTKMMKTKTYMNQMGQWKSLLSLVNSKSLSSVCQQQAHSCYYYALQILVTIMCEISPSCHVHYQVFWLSLWENRSNLQMSGQLAFILQFCFISQQSVIMCSLKSDFLVFAKTNLIKILVD